MPTYRVWDDECETDADATEIAAACESDAAEEWAEQAECCGMFEDGRRISVKDEDGTVTRWTVIVEYSPTYYASPAKAATEPDAGQEM